MASKRKILDEFDVSTMSPSKAARVHGVVVGQLSPIKCSRKNSSTKYFEGHFSDGKMTTRMVSFEPKLHLEMENARKNNQEITLNNVSIKTSRGVDELELILGAHSDIVTSPRKFNIQSSSLSLPFMNISTLDQLKDLNVNQHVTITAKVTEIQKAEKIHPATHEKSLLKQDVTLADSTAAYRGVLWEDNVDTLEELKSYKFNNITIRSFNGAKYFSMSKDSKLKKLILQ